MSFQDNLTKRKGTYVLKSKTGKVRKKGTCGSCGQNSLTRELLYEYNTEDMILVREYMEDHLTTYSNHQSMKPIWCEECNALIEYKSSLNASN